MVLKIECKSRGQLGHSILLFKMHTFINVCFPNMPKGILSHCSDLVADSSTSAFCIIHVFKHRQCRERKCYSTLLVCPTKHFLSACSIVGCKFPQASVWLLGLTLTLYHFLEILTNIPFDWPLGKVGKVSFWLDGCKFKNYMDSNGIIKQLVSQGNFVQT